MTEPNITSIASRRDSISPGTVVTLKSGGPQMTVIERFEQFFAGQVKTYEDWSNLWRFGWWPKAKPELRFPSLGKKKTEPFYRKGTQGFAISLRLATEDERRMWVRFGIAQFKPDDPRVAKIEAAIKREAAE